MSRSVIRARGDHFTVALGPETLAAAGLHEGDLVEASIEDRRIVLSPTTVPPGVRAEVLEIIDQVVADEHAVLQRLEQHDSEK